MNEFTKAELNFIWQRLAIADYTSFPDMQHLANKVCFMIDNQPTDDCQHMLMLCKYFHGEADNKYRCTKCLKTYEEVNERPD